MAGNMKCNKMLSHIDIGQPDGRIVPCCLFDTSLHEMQYGVKWLEHSSIYSSSSNIGESFVWQDMKDKMKEGWIPECFICEDNEDSGHQSMRQVWNKKRLKGGIESLEISLDFTCNFMCRICRPSLSSKWASVKENWTRFDRDHYYVDPNRKMFANKQEEYLKSLDLSNLKSVRLVGGEPFFSKRFEDFIDFLPEGVKLYINTNASIFPNERIVSNIKRKCSSVNVDLSIDAIGDLAQCTRYGTKWNEVDHNIQRHKKTWQATKIFTTISILNINKLIDFN